jgi:hypothetical protein
VGGLHAGAGVKWDSSLRIRGLTDSTPLALLCANFIQVTSITLDPFPRLSNKVPTSRLPMSAFPAISTDAMADAFQVASAAFGLSQILIQLGKEIYDFFKEVPHIHTRLQDLVQRTEANYQDVLCVNDVLEAWAKHHEIPNEREKRLISNLVDRTTECSKSAALIQNEIGNIKRAAAGVHFWERPEFIRTSILHLGLESNRTIPRFESAIGEQKQAISTLLQCLSMYEPLIFIMLLYHEHDADITDRYAALGQPSIGNGSDFLPKRATEEHIRNQSEERVNTASSAHSGEESIKEAVEACKKGDIDSLRSTLGGNVEAGKCSDIKGGRTYLHHVAQHLDGPIAHRFLECLVEEYRTDVNARSKITGETPLHIAVGQRKVELAKALILRGANANVATNGGKTPLSLAVANRVDTQLIELMVKKGATCDVQAIHCRAREKKVQVGQNGMSKVSSSVSERPLRQRFRLSSVSSRRSN